MAKGQPHVRPLWPQQSAALQHSVQQLFDIVVNVGRGRKARSRGQAYQQLYHLRRGARLRGGFVIDTDGVVTYSCSSGCLGHCFLLLAVIRSFLYLPGNTRLADNAVRRNAQGVTRFLGKFL